LYRMCNLIHSIAVVRIRWLINAFVKQYFVSALAALSFKKVYYCVNDSHYHNSDINHNHQSNSSVV